jgi:predicted SAM-dependent methyltransferase
MAKRKLNIGPGREWASEGWMTLDFYNPEADIVLDLRTSPKLPLKSHSIDKVFCSHVIEHLPDEAVASLYAEVHRVLRYNGVARFSCPDAKLALRQFVKRGRVDPTNEIVSYAARKVPRHLKLLNIFASFVAPTYQGRTNCSRGYSGGPIVDVELVQTHARQDSLEEFVRWAVSLIPADASYRAHINAHWDKKVKQMMRAAGFERVKISAFRRSVNAELRGEQFDNRPEMSLFFEARAKSRTKWLFWQVRRAMSKANALLLRVGLVKPDAK